MLAYPGNTGFTYFTSEIGRENMKKLLILVFTCITPLLYLCCSSYERELTELEKAFIINKLKSMQKIAGESIENGNVLELFRAVRTQNDISSFAYAMIISPKGEILAHNDPLKATKMLKDETTQKILEYRDSSNMLIQAATYDDRNVMDYALGVFSSASPDKYLGAVRFALYTE